MRILLSGWERMVMLMNGWRSRGGPPPVPLRVGVSRLTGPVRGCVAYCSKNSSYKPTKSNILFKWLIFSCLTMLAIVSAAGENPQDREPKFYVFSMDTIEVTAESDTDDNLTPTRATSATKTDRELLDTPQAVTVLTEELIQDQQILRLGDLLKNDASISNMGHFGSHEDFSARGFTLEDNGNYLRNGRLFWAMDTPSMEILERTEIIKGPAAALYGQGSPGATINYITKTPTPDPYYAGTVSTGSYHLLYSHLDLSGPISDSEWGYRTNLAWQQNDSFREHYWEKRGVAALSLERVINEDTTFVWSGDFKYFDAPQDTGLVAIGDGVANIPISTSLNPDWTRNQVDSFNTNADLYTQLSDRWRMAAGLSYQNYYRERIISYVVNLQDNGDFQYQFQHRQGTWQVLSGQLDLISDWELGFTDHEVLIGTTYGYIQHNFIESDLVLLDETFNIYDPIDVPPMSLALTNSYQEHDNRYATYIQDIINLSPQWDILLGARYDYYHTSPSNVNDFSANEISSRASLLFYPVESVTTYASFSESFEPNAPVNDPNAENNGQELEPTLSDQYETGLKVGWLQDRLIYSLIGFYIIRHNQPVSEDIPVTDPDQPNVRIIQVGEQHHKGMETSLTGIITPRWQMLGSFMWLDAKIIEDENPDMVGNTPPNAPEFSTSVWSNYQFQHPKLQDFSLQGGVYYQSEREGDDLNTFTLDPFVRVDTGITYSRPVTNDSVLTLRFTVNNILDQEIFYAHRRTNVTIDNPRVWRLSAELAF